MNSIVPCKIYTHWLVTKGREPFDAAKHSLSPIVLRAKDSNSLIGVRRAAVARIEMVALAVVRARRSAVDVIAALVDDYPVAALQDLWLREVRVGIDRTRMDVAPNEVAVRWIGFNMNGEFAPRWQGPSDGVIPRDRPVTVWNGEVAASPFLVVE